MRAKVESSRSRLTDPSVNQYLSDLCREVLGSVRRIDGVDRPGHQRDDLLDIYDNFDVYVVNDVNPNAFVAGDDYTILNTALLAQAESAEELVMVIGHEFGHLRRGHLVDHMTNVQYGLVASEVAKAVADSQNNNLPPGDRARESEQAAATMMAVFVPQRPEKEHESDATGVDVMADLGLNLQYADDLFVRMLQTYGDGSGTHPKPSERIAMIRSQVSELESRGYRPTRNLDPGRFLAMRQRVRELVRRDVENNTIVYWSEELAQASERESIVQPLGCGPLYADPSVASREFLRSIGAK
jgi:predicted Zn-dependent protease